MSTWFSSFLPNFPSVSAYGPVPDSIQLEFLSFFICHGLCLARHHPRKHLLGKHIRSGILVLKNVAISDLVLNNLLLSVSEDFRMQTGLIEKLVMNVSWPNPLGTSISFDVENLDVTFTLPPELWQNQSPIPINLEDELAKAVIAISQAFVIGELSDVKRQILRDMFYPNARETSAEEAVLQSVIMFSSLINSLLSRRYVTWVARVAKLTYSKADDAELDGRLIIAGFRLSLANVEAAPLSPFVSTPIPPPAPPRPMSPSATSIDTRTYVSESLVFALPRKSSVGPDDLEKKTVSLNGAVGDEGEREGEEQTNEKHMPVGSPVIPPFLPETEESALLEPPKVLRGPSSQPLSNDELPLLTLTGDDITITLFKPTKTSPPKVHLTTGVVIATLYAKQFNKAFELVRAYQPQGVAAVNLDINASVVGSVVLNIVDS